MLNIKEIFTNNFNSKEVEIYAFIKNKRVSKKIAFLILKDGTTSESLQAVIFSKDEDSFQSTSQISIGSSVLVKGEIKSTPGKAQPLELVVTKINCLSSASEDFPIQNKEHSLEYLRTIADQRPRTSYFESIFRIRSQVAFAIHEFFNKEGYIYLHSPIITRNDAEGGGESFKLKTSKFFGVDASLSVSGQLNGEAFAMAFKKIYTFGPTFRAEKSNTPRHLAEFWMIEPEVHFASLKDIIKVAFEMLKYIFKFIKHTCTEDLKLLSEKNEIDLIKRIDEFTNSDYEVIEYVKAISLLQKHQQEFDNKNIKFGLDLETEHEKFLCEKIYNKPIFVCDYPKEFKAFYMSQNEDKKTVASFDLLVPGVGELIGGSQREGDHNKLIQRAKEMNLDIEELEWYFDLRKYGYAKSSGFGLGFERLVMYITGTKNIKDVVPFPRSYGSLKY